MSLEIELEIETKGRLRNVGVGLMLNSKEGVKVSVIAPAVTNYVIDEIHGVRKCLLYCQDIGSYLAGGDYVLGIWLARPRIEYLLQVDQVALISIPPKDMFSNGVYFEARYYGFVPLPFKFEVI
jgi:hypothetical protein